MYVEEKTEYKKNFSVLKYVRATESKHCAILWSATLEWDTASILIIRKNDMITAGVATVCQPLCSKANLE